MQVNQESFDRKHNDKDKAKSKVTDNMKEYLSLVQEPIGRLSTSSALFKGFAATIVTGIGLLSYENMSSIILVLSFLPVIAFLALDLYYLQLEKCYRGLYNDILSGRHDLDFRVDIPKDREFRKRAKATVWDCVKSPSIWMFYVPIFIVLLTILLLKTYGVI